MTSKQNHFSNNNMDFKYMFTFTFFILLFELIMLFYNIILMKILKS